MARIEWTRAEVAGGYLNFFLNQAKYAASLLAQIDENFGRSEEGAGKTVCLDYSSINIAKRFHIGHLSTTMIGHSLKRIYEYLGWRAIGINHLGDWGTQFGKMICAYKLWGNSEEVEQGGVDAMTALYVRFHEEAEKDSVARRSGPRVVQENRRRRSGSAGDFQLVQGRHAQGRQTRLR